MPYDNQPQPSLLSGLRTQKPMPASPQDQAAGLQLDDGRGYLDLNPQSGQGAPDMLASPFSDYANTPEGQAALKQRQRQQRMEQARRVAKRGAMQIQAGQRVQSKSAGY
jgi:hypothetical protein